MTAFLDHWGKHLPDTSEGRPPKLTELQFWKSLCATLKAHSEFPGLCAKWLHIALDFAIANNMWPVRFMKGSEEYDLATPFILAVWVCYAGQMNGSPDLASKAPQKVLLYLLTQPNRVVKSWRKRQYFYASATIFREVSPKLRRWLHNSRDEETVAPEDLDLLKRTQALRHVQDYDGLHGLLGDAILSFIRAKRAPFPGAMLSKKHFLTYATWKRAFIFVKLMRELTCQHANKHWNKFGYVNYRLNHLCFKFYCENDEKIWSCSSLFQELADTWEDPARDDAHSTPVKQRTRKRFELSSPEGNPVSTKRARIICILSDTEAL